MEQEHIYTSTGVKFWRHPEQMISFLQGTGKSVISTHISPTSQCQLNCSYCSVAKRKQHESIELNVIIKYIEDLIPRGLKAIILTGGGESTMYPQWNELMNKVRGYNLKLGLITNGVDLEGKHLDMFDWIRVSINHGSTERISWSEWQVKPDVTIGMSLVYSGKNKEFPISYLLHLAARLKAEYIRVIPNCLPEDLNEAHKEIDQWIYGSPEFDTRLFMHQRKVHRIPLTNYCTQAYFRPYLSEIGGGTVFPCFPGNTLIQTEKGLISIDKINVGMKVLSHDGKFHAVSKLYKRKYDGKLISLTPTGYSQFPIIATPNHKIWSARKIGKRYKYKGDFKSEIKSNADKMKYGKWFGYEEFKFIRIDELNKGDILTQSINEYDDGIVKKEQLTLKKMFFYGLYLAEGWTINKGRQNAIWISLHSNETKLADRTIDILNKTFKLNVNQYFRKNNVRLNCSSKMLVDYLDSTFGKYADRKKIPFHWIKLPDKYLLKLLEGIWQGDGGYNEDHKYSYITTSENIFHFMRLAFIKLKIPFHTSIRKARKGKDGKMRKIAYLINSSDNRMNMILNEKKDLSLKSNKIWYEKDKLLYTIKKIEDFDYSGYVYNLEVEDVHSYNLIGASVSNCDSVVLNDKLARFDSKYAICKAAEVGDFLDGKIQQQFDPSEDCKSCVFADNVEMLTRWRGGYHQFHIYTKPIKHEDFV